MAIEQAIEIIHPLEPLTRNELVAVAGIVKRELASLGEGLRFEMIELKEPPKSVVRAFKTGDPINREAQVNVYCLDAIGVWRLVVSITEQTIVSKSHIPDACPMIQLEEFLQIEEVVKKHPDFIAACAKRGISDMELVCVDPWSGGNFGHDDETGKHVSHAFCWLKTSVNDNLYAHPIEGLNPVVDIKKMELIRIDDYGVVSVPQTNYNYDREFQTHTRDDLRPLDIHQPEGVSFTLQGRTLHWHDWSILIGFNAREALTLHNISFTERPVCYRASLAEMVVPYGSPDNAHYRKSVFDIGEYGLGKLTNSLALGCDCLGSIHYLDAWISDINGDPMCIENAICIHEEDNGILWKHWDFRTERTEVRPFAAFGYFLNCYCWQL